MCFTKRTKESTQKTLLRKNMWYRSMVVNILSMRMESKSIVFQEEFKNLRRKVKPTLEYPFVINSLENSCCADILRLTCPPMGQTPCVRFCSSEFYKLIFFQICSLILSLGAL